MAMQSVICFLAICGLVDESYLTWTAEQVATDKLPASVGRRLSQAELDALRKSEPRLPYSDLTTGVRLDDGSLWIGATRGLLHLMPSEPRWRLFHSRRWLPDDRILELAVTADQGVFVRTPAGGASTSVKPPWNKRSPKLNPTCAVGTSSMAW
jgi:hypothetical protein